MYRFKKYDIAETTKITYNKNDASGGIEDLYFYMLTCLNQHRAAMAEWLKPSYL